MKAKKERDPYKMTALQATGWAARGVSVAANVVVLTYLTIFCTDMLGIPAVTAGMVLLASKVFDGFSDLIAGYIIDKTSTRFGKARPYEFCIIGVWLCTILLFACPDMGVTGKCIWIFVMYTFVNSIFVTFLSSSDSVYLCRAFKYDDDRVTIASVTGIFVMLFSTLISIIFPILMGTLGTTKQGWIPMIAIFAIPLTLIGLLRFFFVKEVVEVDQTAPKLTVSDFLEGLKSNYYIYILFFVSLLTFIVTNMGTAVGTYYFTWIVGNIESLSAVGMLSLTTPIFLIFFPMIMKKLSTAKMIFLGSIIGVVGCVIKAFAGTSMPMLLAGNLLAVISVLPISYYAPLLIIDIMDYHEYKTGKRVEAVFGSIYGLAGKVGAGFASGIVGVIMGLAGYDGLLTVQPDSAIKMIVALYGWIPAVMLAIAAVLMHFFNLEEKLPEIRAELEARKAK